MYSFPHFLPFNVLSKSLISSDSQWLAKLVLVVQLWSLQQISGQKNNFVEGEWWTVGGMWLHSHCPRLEISSSLGSSPGWGHFGTRHLHCNPLLWEKLPFYSHFLVIWKIVEKPTATTFQLTTRNLHILLCTLRFFVHLYVCNTDFHLAGKQLVIGSFEFLSLIRSFFCSLGSYPAELLYTNGVLWVFSRVSQLNYIPVKKFYS